MKKENTQTAMCVPNAPCGVESCVPPFKQKNAHPVPNAPCGVERTFYESASQCVQEFLMHRVELKVRLYPAFPQKVDVPNAPCGVERQNSTSINSQSLSRS